MKKVIKIFKDRKENEFLKKIVLNGNSLSIENGNCIVPEGVISIVKYCLNECGSLTRILLSSSLSNIGSEAFIILFNKDF